MTTYFISTLKSFVEELSNDLTINGIQVRLNQNDDLNDVMNRGFVFHEDKRGVVSLKVNHQNEDIDFEINIEVEKGIATFKVLNVGSVDLRSCVTSNYIYNLESEMPKILYSGSSFSFQNHEEFQKYVCANLILHKVSQLYMDKLLKNYNS